MTRQGFALDRIEETFYPAVSTEIGPELIRDNLKTINNIRLWDYRPLSSVYKQIQLIRPYYDFKDADVDRYYINGEYRQVLLSAREVAPEKLSPESQTWGEQQAGVHARDRDRDEPGHGVHVGGPACVLREGHPRGRRDTDRDSGRADAT